MFSFVSCLHMQSSCAISHQFVQQALLSTNIWSTLCLCDALRYKLNTQGPMGAGARTTRCGGRSARWRALVPYLLATPPLPLPQPNYRDKFVFCRAKA